MLQLLLVLLKIIGFALLALLGLLLLLVLVILVVPIRYRGRGSFYGKPEGTFQVTWLFHLLSFRAAYADQWEAAVRLLGFRLFQEKGKKAEEDLAEEPILSGRETVRDTVDPKIKAELQSEIHSLDAPEPAPPEPNALKPDAPEPDKPGERQKGGTEAGAGRASGAEEDADGDADGGGGRPAGSRTKVFSRVSARIKEFWSRLRLSFERLKARMRELGEKKEALSAFLEDEENHKTFRLVKRLAVKAFRHVLPRKLRGELTFGLEDPYLMGQILSGAALFYPLYHKSIFLTPIFDRKIIEGELSFRGRIRVGVFLVIGLRLLFHKNFRVLLKKALNQGGI